MDSVIASDLGRLRPSPNLAKVSRSNGVSPDIPATSHELRSTPIASTPLRTQLRFGAGASHADPSPASRETEFRSTPVYRSHPTTAATTTTTTSTDLNSSGNGSGGAAALAHPATAEPRRGGVDKPKSPAMKAAPRSHSGVKGTPAKPRAPKTFSTGAKTPLGKKKGEREPDPAALKATIEKQKQEIEELHEAMQKQAVEFEEEIQACEARKNEELEQRDMRIDELEQDKVRLENEVTAQKNEARQRIQALTDEANARIEEYERVITRFQQEVANLESTVQQRDERIAQIEKERDARYQQYEEYLMIGEKSRAELHNALIEMKGNIRVFARVRPVLSEEKLRRVQDFVNHYTFPEGTDHRALHVVDVPGHTSAIPGKSEPSKTLPFQFDKAFGPSASQQQIFDEISQLVQSALDGYKVCIFAYGQTGSGKTYTMEGPEPGVAHENSGMIARAVHQIFDNCQWKSKQSGFRFKLLCSFLEIYNETIHDLLNPQEFYDVVPHKERMKHEIRNTETETIITDVKEEEVTDPAQVHRLLSVANDNRRTAGTKMNDRASRSHSVFIMKIKGWNEATRQEINGQLNLIDLAGSERLHKSQAEGDRLRETQHINKSLACLGDVIAALAKEGNNHVPFRQSKLTHLLQPSMSNESKTLMFVNINPLPEHLHESLCSLRFAAKVNSCEIGIARRRINQK